MLVDRVEAVLANPRALHRSATQDIGTLLSGTTAIALRDGGSFGLLASGVYSMRSLLNLVSLNVVPRLIMRVLEWFRLVRGGDVSSMIDADSRRGRSNEEGLCGVG
jgi:hypothetical protein